MRQREEHHVVVDQLSGRAGSVTVAANMFAADTAPSARVIAGAFRSAAASGSARNGSASIR